VTVNKDELKAGVAMIAAVAEAIREVGQIPSGHLYARLQGKVTLDGYNKLIGILKNAKLIEENNHLLTWIGPEIK
jgi:hypothetical protein